uniref:Uncharacterized protein n=1 Tax=Arundo donax TaxID=35708 RepID=A0A0A8XVF5_ARUDO
MNYGCLQLNLSRIISSISFTMQP